MSKQDIFDLALARSAWHSMVVRLAWTNTPMPALTNLAELPHASAFAGVDWELILYDDSAPTALERADGNLGAVLPITLTTLKTLKWDLVCFAMPTSWPVT